MSVGQFPETRTNAIYERLSECLLLGFAAASTCIGALDGPFYYFDDKQMIFESPFIRGERSILSSFWMPYFHHYAPLHEFLLYVQWYLFGATPIAFRIVNILLHFCAALTCWKMLTAISGRARLSLGVTLLWAAHPAHSESTAWIVESKTLGSGLFSFWAIALYADSRRSQISAPSMAMAMALTIVACLFKIQSIVVAPILVLLEIILNPCERKGDCPNSLARRLLWTLPFAAIATLFLVIGYFSFEKAKSPLSWTPIDFMINLPATLMLYFHVTVFPWSASFFHGSEPTRSVVTAAFIAPMIGGLALFIFGYWFSGSRRRLFLFSILAWIAGIGPMLNVSILTFPGHDRFQYIGMPFLLLAIALATEGVWNYAASIHPDQRPSKVAAGFLWIPLLMIMFVLGMQRSLLFVDEIWVIEDALQKAPDSGMPHAALASRLVGAWNVALLENRPEDQRKLAQRMVSELNIALKTWNFLDLYFHPATAMLECAAAAKRSGLDTESKTLVQRVANEPHWNRYPQEQSMAHCMLAYEALENKKADAPQIALAHLLQARQLSAPTNDVLLLESRVHLLLSEDATRQGDNITAQSHRDEARKCLQGVSIQSAEYKAAQEALARLK